MNFLNKEIANKINNLLFTDAITLALSLPFIQACINLGFISLMLFLTPVYFLSVIVVKYNATKDGYIRDINVSAILYNSDLTTAQKELLFKAFVLKAKAKFEYNITEQSWSATNLVSDVFPKAFTATGKTAINAEIALTKMLREQLPEKVVRYK